MIRRPPRSTRTYTLFPYTTLFRSARVEKIARAETMNLIDNANQWLRLWSMRWAITTAFLAAIPAAYIMLPADWLPAIPQWIKSRLALAKLFSAGATGVARMLKRSEERRVGNEGVSACRYRWSPSQ